MVEIATVNEKKEREQQLGINQSQEQDELMVDLKQDYCDMEPCTVLFYYVIICHSDGVTFDVSVVVLVSKTRY